MIQDNVFNQAAISHLLFSSLKKWQRYFKRCNTKTGPTRSCCLKSYSAGVWASPRTAPPRFWASPRFHNLSGPISCCLTYGESSSQIKSDFLLLQLLPAVLGACPLPPRGTDRFCLSPPTPTVPLLCCFCVPRSQRRPWRSDVALESQADGGLSSWDQPTLGSWWLSLPSKHTVLHYLHCAVQTDLFSTNLCWEKAIKRYFQHNLHFMTAYNTAFPTKAFLTHMWILLSGQHCERPLCHQGTLARCNWSSDTSLSEVLIKKIRFLKS